MKIYCEDLERNIDEGECYSAKGSPVCQVCLEKQINKKLLGLVKKKKDRKNRDCPTNLC
jgi:hypothetical protein